MHYQLIIRIAKRLHILLFVLLIIIGLIIVKDYNISSDEPINRSNGGVSANAINNKINNVFGTKFFENDPQFKEFNTDLNTYFDRDYGVAFDMPLFYIERLFKINEAKDQYILRHKINYLIFIVGLIAFYRIAMLRFQNRNIALFALLMLVMSPRIFADAYYNYKDILFLSVIIIAVYTMIKALNNPSFLRILAHGLTTGIAIDVRILGVIIFVGTIGLIFIKLIKHELTITKTIKFILLFTITTVFFVIAFWPWLWINPIKFNLWHIPIDRFAEAFSNMSKFRWEGLILFNGSYYPADKIPRYYLPVWIVISTPFIYTLLFIIGLIKTFYDQIILKLKLWKSESEFYDLIFVFIFFIPIISIILLKSVVYDGWRQVYFIYPFMILIATVGLCKVYNSIKKYNLLKRILLVIFLMYIGNIAYLMYKNHPYQMVYFSEIMSSDNITKFELDYWGLSTKEALQEILKRDQRQEIKVYSLGNTTVRQTLHFLGKNYKDRIKIIDDYKDADYVLFNHRIISFSNIPVFIEINNHRSIFYQVKSNGKSLFTVYK